MRTVRLKSRFKRDYRREKSGRHSKTLDVDLMEIVNLLVADKPLLPHHCDHSLSGNWINCRDCHIKPDLVLIYCKPDDEHLYLARLGSHSELDL
jgi:mRNA interferase YafQ